MNTIETIRAEVERLKKEELTRNSIGVITGSAFFVSANELLSFLDTLPEQPASDGLEEEIKRYRKEEMPVVLDSDLNDIARHFAEWGMNQCPLPEDTTIFQKGVAEGRRLEREEQRPELVQHPAISYMFNADAGRGEQLKQAVLALLKSDLIQVAGRGFTKTELIEWVETRPAEIKEDK